MTSVKHGFSPLCGRVFIAACLQRSMSPASNHAERSNRPQVLNRCFVLSLLLLSFFLLPASVFLRRSNSLILSVRVA